MPDLEYYLAQARRIEEHREAQAEVGMRKAFKNLLKNLQGFLGEEYANHSEDGKLSYEILQKKARYARFIDEVEKKVIKGTEESSNIVKKTVDDTYKAAFDGMIDAVKKADGNSEELKKAFKSVKYVKPETLKKAVENPVSGLTLKDTLEKNRAEIVYNIKQTVGIGLQNGDRYETMAKRVAESLDGDYQKAIRIVRTETHRVQQAGKLESALAIDEKLKKGNSGMRYYKTWRTAKDERVRKPKGKNKANHKKMEGVTILVDEEFDLGHGVKAMAPGMSGDAGNDINCRCRLSFRLKKATNSDKIEVEKSLENYNTYADKRIDKNFNSINKSQKEFLKETIDTIVEKNDFSMMIDSDIVQDVIDKGFLNQFETQTSGGSLNYGWRRAATKQLFGADADNMKPSEFEKYGFLGSKNTYESFKTFGTSQYGDVIVKFKKDNLIDRTTYTIDDSLGLALMKKIIGGKVGVNSNIGGVRTDGIKQITELFMFMNDDAFDNATKVAQSLGGRYWELQYHGKLTIEDVESMTFKSTPDEKIVRKLKENNVKVYVLNERRKGTDEI